MKWNWELESWPKFECNSDLIAKKEREFLFESGGGEALLNNLEEDQKKLFIVEILSLEAEKSALIEGEFLERDSLRSSIQRHLGLKLNHKERSKEKGMADLLWDMYKTYQEPLSHEMLFRWHRMLMEGESSLIAIGKYRDHEDPMQIISGRLDGRKVFFEAPPSSRVPDEMSRFIDWFNQDKTTSILTKAAISHVYFESIHPFEDGNGRIGRALIEKSLSKSLKRPTFLAISEGISRRKKEYYDALGSCNRSLQIQTWLEYFSSIVLESKRDSLDLVYFLVEKAKLFNKLEGKLNARQEKVLLRVFQEGPSGFKGGLSAENYIQITKTSRATATRDLQGLVDLGAFFKTGELKSTRYWLKLKSRQS